MECYWSFKGIATIIYFQVGRNLNYSALNEINNNKSTSILLFLLYENIGVATLIETEYNADFQCMQ